MSGNIGLVKELWFGTSSKPFITNPAVDLVIRPVTHTGAVQGLGAQHAAEAVAVVEPTSGDHLLCGKHFTSAPGTATYVPIAGNRSGVQWHGLGLGFLAFKCIF